MFDILAETNHIKEFTSVTFLPLELYHYHSTGVMRFRRFVQNCNWDKISSVISFTALLVLDLSFIIQRKNKIYLKLMMHKMEQVHSEVINIVEFGWARYISLTHTIFWSCHIFHSILVRQVADDSFSYLSTSLQDIQSLL